VTGNQTRRTAGIIATTEETRLHIDPGPGALVHNHAEMEEPLSTEAVLVSHAHPDHCSDAQPIIEMMTEVAQHPGAIFSNPTALEGHSDIEKAISNYHQDLCVTVETLEQGTETEFEDLEIKSQQMFHSDPKTAGFILEDGEHSIGFWTDTEYSHELVDFYQDCDIMVIYSEMPKDSSVPSHTSLSEVPDILEEIGPNTAIITHFGKTFLNSDMEEQEEWLDEKVDCKVIFAEDNMEFPGNRSLTDF
jgi:ribonuclease BN (tRNA processing enzyme)